ncbi:MAG: M23 family metallopeptidase [Xenococcaceae cyanobacterium]
MILRSKRNLVFILFGLGLTIMLGCLSVPSRSQLNHDSANNYTPSLIIPIDCNLDRDCFIMHYVDRDPSPEELDFGCGRQTYDGHKGTDFAISDLQTMKEGVSVLAAAKGTVLRVRDGIEDQLFDEQSDRQALEGRECGNGMIIDHGNGWETQYCHLRKGSVTVKPGIPVEQGTVLGKVGSSGFASFPHIHLVVRYQGKTIDPFVGKDSTTGCNIERDPLWSKSLDYVPTGLIRSGFASQPPNQTELWQGKYTENQFSLNTPALVFWVHAYGVLKGDIEKWQLIDPNGEVVVQQEQQLEQSYRTWVSYVGKRTIIPGVWQGEYQLLRDNNAVLTVKRELEVN